ncbi:IS630 transposase-related protein [Streptococcus pneumoniae]|uniref:IS630 transposase-related protein n=2 Tax=Streptococcus pneumoniae TaxID=1313 RepID=UPI001F11E529|nr:IS630 transposase-related protein [Streptococcus pneumoniae]
MDFRKKILSYCERTGSITEASHVFQISRNTIYGWLKLKEKTGELNHQVKGTKPRKVDRDRLKNYLTDNPDAYLTEIASEFGCHPTKLELLCEEFGHKLLPLPPYSPEYNPIEKTWAHIKKNLKKVLPSCNTFYEALLSCSCFN